MIGYHSMQVTRETCCTLQCEGRSGCPDNRGIPRLSLSMLAGLVVFWLAVLAFSWWAV